MEPVAGADIAPLTLATTVRKAMEDKFASNHFCNRTVKASRRLFISSLCNVIHLCLLLLAL
jgi:hypothetical protein